MTTGRNQSITLSSLLCTCLNSLHTASRSRSASFNFLPQQHRVYSHKKCEMCWIKTWNQ